MVGVLELQEDVDAVDYALQMAKAQRLGVLSGIVIDAPKCEAFLRRARQEFSIRPTRAAARMASLEFDGFASALFDRLHQLEQRLFPAHSRS